MPTIGSFPGFFGLNDDNPYQALFYRALNNEGIRWWGKCDPWHCDISGAWPDIVHLHWPDLLWQDRPPQFIKKLWRLPGGWRAYQSLKQGVSYIQMKKLTQILRRIKEDGRKVVWTLHNVNPHEGNYLADRHGYRALCELVDLAISHSHTAIGEFERCHGKLRRVVVMPHGNYDDVYPTARPRDLVLSELGLATGKPTLCCLGNMRAYKGMDLAVDAVARLNGRVQLIIAGKPHPSYDVASLIRRMKEVPGAVLLQQFLGTQQFSDLTCAADATLLPYRQITGSGVLLASLTLGTGVIASDLPYFAEILRGEESAGALFPVGDSLALRDAVETYLEIPREERFRSALNLAGRYSWPRMVVPVAEAIRDLFKE